MAEIHAARRYRAQQKIAESGADAALITSGPNVRYLTGLVSSNAAVLLPAHGDGVLATDSRYVEAAERDCADIEIATERQVEPALATLAAERGYGTSSEYVRELIRKDRDRQSLRALVMEGARSAPASPADAAYFDDLRSRIRHADGW